VHYIISRNILPPVLLSGVLGFGEVFKGVL